MLLLPLPSPHAQSPQQHSPHAASLRPQKHAVCDWRHACVKGPGHGQRHNCRWLQCRPPLLVPLLLPGMVLLPSPHALSHALLLSHPTCPWALFLHALLLLLLACV